MAAAQTRAVAELMLLKGLRILEVPPEWIEEQAFFGVPVPDDPRERLFAYLESRFFPTATDVVALMSKVARLSLSGVVEEEEIVRRCTPA
jgi:hypothetical protein